MKKSRVVIVGGGSAGWMTACYLNHVFGNNSQFEVTLIESADVPTIGVGEATVHTLRGFLEACDLSEGEFMVATDATLKHGILFKHWQIGDDPKDQYFHPFEDIAPIAPEGVINHWLNLKFKSVTPPRFDRFMGVQGILAAAEKSPKLMHDSQYRAPVPYGYHLDAIKFAHFLRDVSVKRGVKHICDHVTDVNHQDGIIGSVRLASGQQVEGDLFIDCSGFRSILASALGARFISYSDKLFCDKAVTARVPQSDKFVPKPYTTATARRSGWTFDIDLQSRKGLGYVYSSQHLSEMEAEAEFRQVFGLGDEQGVNHFTTRVGRQDRAWVGNCVSIGLAQGFIEPLESTGLYFIEMSLRFLTDYLVLEDSDAARDKYNAVLNNLFDQTVDFIVLHYVLTKRHDTPFWQDVQTNMARSDDLNELLQLWKHKAPTDSDFLNAGLIFRATNYAAILYGMESLPQDLPTIVRHMGIEQSHEVLSKIQSVQKMAITSSPSHQEFLQKFLGAFS